MNAWTIVTRADVPMYLRSLLMLCSWKKAALQILYRYRFAHWILTDSKLHT